MTDNKYGLSKKTNVAIAAITAITIVCNASFRQAVIGISAIVVIALYHLYNQSKLDNNNA